MARCLTLCPVWFFVNIFDMRTFFLGLLFLIFPFVVPFVLAHYVNKLDDLIDFLSSSNDGT
jgi:hypothetical protein